VRVWPMRPAQLPRTAARSASIGRPSSDKNMEDLCKHRPLIAKAAFSITAGKPIGRQGEADELGSPQLDKATAHFPASSVASPCQHLSNHSYFDLRPLQRHTLKPPPPETARVGHPDHPTSKTMLLPVGRHAPDIAASSANAHAASPSPRIAVHPIESKSAAHSGRASGCLQLVQNVWILPFVCLLLRRPGHSILPIATLCSVKIPGTRFRPGLSQLPPPGIATSASAPASARLRRRLRVSHPVRADAGNTPVDSRMVSHWHASSSTDKGVHPAGRQTHPGQRRSPACARRSAALPLAPARRLKATPECWKLGISGRKTTCQTPVSFQASCPLATDSTPPSRRCCWPDADDHVFRPAPRRSCPCRSAALQLSGRMPSLQTVCLRQALPTELDALLRAPNRRCADRPEPAKQVRCRLAVFGRADLPDRPGEDGVKETASQRVASPAHNNGQV